MNLKAKILLSLAFVGVLFLTLPTASLASPSLCDAVPGNLVINCGFETGDFTGWNVIDAPVDSLVFVNNVAPNSGTYDVWFGAYGSSDDTIYQTLGTDPGVDYTFSFWLANLDPASPGDADFDVFWDATNVLSAPTSAFGYTQYAFTETGTGSDTVTFSGRSVPSYYLLDDVVVTPTPEPSSWLLFITGLLGVATIFRRRLSVR